MVIGGPTVEFSNGVKMPLVGLGTWQTQSDDGRKALHIALDEGYRLIDTATVYKNEEEIGDVLQEFFKAGKLKREEVFITTKCWPPSLRPGAVEPALRESLKKLKLDYVDLYLAHMPCAFLEDNTTFDTKTKLEDFWPEFEKIYEKKLARAIGISNFNVEQVERVVKVAKVRPHNHQIELQLYLPQVELLEVAKKYNISVTSYGSLGSPGRTNVELVLRGKKMPWTEVPDALKDPRVVKLAEKYNKTPGQILLRFLVDRGIAVIPKSSNPERIKQNIDIFDFKLTPEEVKELLNTKTRARVFKQEFLIGHPDDPFKDER